MRWKIRVGKDGYAYLPREVASEGDRFLIQKTEEGKLLLTKVEEDITLREVATRRRIYLGDLVPKKPLIIEKVAPNLFLLKIEDEEG